MTDDIQDVVSLVYFIWCQEINGTKIAFKMDKIDHPSRLELTGNLAENYRWFEQRFDIYMLATGKSNKPDEQKTAMFLHLAGEEAIRLYNTFEWQAEGDKDKLAKVKENFKEHCNAHTSRAFLRHQLLTRRQEEGESVEQYVTVLKTMAKHCEFGPLTDSLIIDVMLLGIADNDVKQKIMEEQTRVDLNKAVSMCRAAEASRNHLRSLDKNAEAEGASQSANLDQIKTKKTNKPKKQAKNKKDGKPNIAHAGNKHTCKRCGRQHPPRSCPAWGKQCSKCNGPNHFADYCFTGKAKVHSVEYENNELFIGNVERNTTTEDDDWYVRVKVNQKPVKLKIDTGAQANVISKATLKRNKKDTPVTKTKLQLTGVTSSWILI